MTLSDFQLGSLGVAGGTGLLNFGLGVANSILGSKAQSDANALNRELFFESQRFNEYMYDKNYNNQIKFWDMQNAYNSPYNQMQLYKKAGINPYLAVGNISSNAQNMSFSQTQSPSAPSQSAEFFPLSPMQDSLSEKLYDLDRYGADLDSIRSNTNLVNSEQQLSVLKRINQQIRNTHDDLELSILKDTRRAVISSIESQADSSYYQSLQSRLDYYFNEKTFDARLDETFSRAGLARFELQHLAPERIRQLRATTQQIFAEIGLTLEQTATQRHLTQSSRWRAAMDNFGYWMAQRLKPFTLKEREVMLDNLKNYGSRELKTNATPYDYEQWMYGVARDFLDSSNYFLSEELESRQAENGTTYRKKARGFSRRSRSSKRK